MSSKEISDAKTKSCILCYFLKLNRKPRIHSDILLLSFSFGTTSEWWQAAWGCAGDAWGFPVRIVELQGIPLCRGKRPQKTSMSCARMQIMKAFLQETEDGVTQGMKDLDLYQRPSWIFFFGTDAFPLHASCIRQFAKESSPSLVLFEDFETGAVNDANFFARVDHSSGSFFQLWYDFCHSLGSKTEAEYSALETLLLHWLNEGLNYGERPLENVNGSLHWVKSRFQSIQDLETYDRYVATSKYVLGPRRRFEHFWLLRRGQGLCLDIALPFDHKQIANAVCFKDRAVIAPKEVDKGCMTKVLTCQESISACMLFGAGSTKHIHTYRPQHMGLGMVNDIEECWPKCPPNVPGNVWEDMERGLLFNARCPNHQCRLGCCCKDFDLLSEQDAAESADAFLVGLLGLLLLGLGCFALQRVLSKRGRRSGEAIAIELTTLR